MYRLALRTGRLDVDALLNEMSVQQLIEWQAFERLEPFGHPATNWFFGVFSALISNIFRNPKTPFKKEDFEYNYAADLLHPVKEELMTQNDLEEKFMMVMQSFGAVIPKKETD